VPTGYRVGDLVCVDKLSILGKLNVVIYWVEDGPWWLNWYGWLRWRAWTQFKTWIWEKLNA